jgi:hypothetical protein
MTLGHDALGMIGPESGMDSEYLVHCIDDLFRDRLLLRQRNDGQQQTKPNQCSNDLAAHHAVLLRNARTI